MFLKFTIDLELSESINSAFLSLDRDLNEFLRVAETQVSSEEFTDLRRSVGDVLGILYQDVMLNIYEQHKEIKPEGMP